MLASWRGLPDGAQTERGKDSGSSLRLFQVVDQDEGEDDGEIVVVAVVVVEPRRRRARL